MTAHDPHSLASCTFANRDITTALFEIATPIAEGAAASAIKSKPPAFLGAAFPNIADDELDRIAALISWAMYVQHTATAREIERRRRIAAILRDEDHEL